MVTREIKRWSLGLATLAILSLSVHSAAAQNIVVDATPSHVVNTFSPPHALGGAIDRLRAGEGAPGAEETHLTKEQVDKNTDMLLSDPVLKEILGRTVPVTTCTSLNALDYSLLQPG